MSVQVTCPGCGAPIFFKVKGSVVVVCEFCQQVVARGDVDIEDLGKSNPVIAVPTVFKLGATGRFRDRPFTIVGRTQLSHQLGGTWNEWYAAFENGRWGWIAEHQGRIAILGEVSASQAPEIHSVDAAEPGSRWFSGRGSYVVNERGVATVVAEEGELPWRALPNEQRAYVDLSAPGGGFGTIDFGAMRDGAPAGPRRFYVGHEVAVTDLALEWPGGEKPPLTLKEQEAAMEGQGGFGGAPKVAAVKVDCPNCGAPLEMQREDAQTLSCSSCASILDVDANKKLRLLQKQSLRFSPQIPIGSKGTFDGDAIKNFPAEYRRTFEAEVVAYLVRELVDDGETFNYYEHLLHGPTEGYLWLVLNEEGLWLFRPINAADVEVGLGVKYQGKPYRNTENYTPSIAQIQGELYWKARLNETSSASDYVGFSGRLSSEKTPNEMNWTFGFGTNRNILSKVFGVRVPGPPVSSYSSAGSSGGGGNNQMSPMAIFIVLVIMLMFFSMCTCGGFTGGGGGHSSYSSSGGYSYGK